jgi:hypothetical protein
MITCDHCRREITSGRTWHILLDEDHGVWRGTMGRERHYDFDLCRECGDDIIRKINALIEPLASASQETPPS